MDSIEDIFRYQVSLYILQPLRFQRIFREGLKKTSGADRLCPNNSHVKYIIELTRDTKESSRFNKDNVNTLWEDYILK